MNMKAFGISVLTVLIYDCIFVNIEYYIKYNVIYSVFPSVLSKEVDGINPCIGAGICKYNRNKPQALPVCYCDSSCIQNNDCCSDANVDTTPDAVSIRRFNPSFGHCQNEVFTNKWFGVYMVAKCPSTFNVSDISKKCSLAQNLQPLFASDGNNYRNVYCTYCHNVRRYTPWEFQFHYDTDNCSSEKMKLLNATVPTRMRYIMENKCKYFFLPPKVARYRTCFKDITNMETSSNPLCLRFQNPVDIGNKLYRNFHCYNGTDTGIEPLCLKLINLDVRAVLMLKKYSNLQLTGIFNIYPVLDIFGMKNCNEEFYYDKTMVKTHVTYYIAF